MRSRRLVLTAALLAALVAPAWGACCYFSAKDKDITQPGQKAFITWSPGDKVESFTVQPRFEGNALDFGMVIPTPSQPKLDEMPRDLFKDLAIYTILLPLPQAIELEDWRELAKGAWADGAKSEEEGSAVPRAVRRSSVRVLEAGVVGSLDYKIIVAEDATGLFDWLKENRYSYAGDEKTLDFYIAKRWFFTVMKIDSKAMKKNPDGTYLGEITPTRFTFKSESCIYPLKITQLSVKDKTDALFYVQSPEQMDLADDLSWSHSFRVMYLTYMLGCSASETEQRELEARNRWLEEKRRGDPAFETTKLEWARRLGEAELATLEDPVARWPQATADLPPGSKVISKKELLDAARAYLEGQKRPADSVKRRLAELDAEHPDGKGAIVHVAESGRKYFYGSEYLWCPSREAPEADVKGLSRLKGHLQKGQWLTKFRKVLRKDEMADDLVLVPVASERQQAYVRIMPTSPP